MREDKRVVIVICDSLRRDLIGEQDTPFLVELQKRGTGFNAHRSVFPSTTRASSASIATGCLPARHGLYGNTQALDEGDGLVCRNVGAPDFRDRMRRATGRTLHVPTLAERLRWVCPVARRMRSRKSGAPTLRQTRPSPSSKAWVLP